MSTDEADGPDDDGPDDGPDDAAANAPGVPGAKRKRRRRRRRGGGDPNAPTTDAAATLDPAAPPAPAPAAPASGAPDPAGDPGRRQYRGGGRGAPAPASPPTTQPAAGDPAVPTVATVASDRGRRRRRGGEGAQAEGAPTQPPRGDGRGGQRNPQRSEPRGGPGGQRGGARNEPRGGGGGRRNDPRNDLPRVDQSDDEVPDTLTPAAAPTPAKEAPMARLQQKQRAQQSDDEPAAPAELWGQDDEPAVAITLSANLPALPPADDFAPLTFDVPAAQPGGETLNVAGVRFVSAGRIQWCDASDGEYVLGERVVVDSDRGNRVAWIAVASARKVTRERGLRRIVKRATEADREPTGDGDLVPLLRAAKDKAARLPLKVFRVELAGAPGRGGKLLVYYTTEESRLDMRQFIHELGTATQTRVELRQLGVRDEAKAVGGIGSCGLTLCCTTWLPDFVPVSIKMAKDQGLVLSPTKVAGQCGRLKCCLIYEQAGYAELRKGLPKLGKRVVSAKGEGRVVEVDVLRQRVRVSYGMGDSEVLPAVDVKPLFPPGTQPPQPGRDPRGPRGPRPSPATQLPPDDAGSAAVAEDDEADDPIESAPIAAVAVPEIDLPEPETASPLAYASELPDEDPSRDPSIGDDEEDL